MNDAAPSMETTADPYGFISRARPTADRLQRPRFRLAILGDFTGRAARGKAETGAALAGRRAIRFDVDTVEDVIEGFATRLVLPVGDGAIEVDLPNLDAMHPDELVSEVEIFQELKGLRQQLKGGMAAKAVDRLKAWAEKYGVAVKVPRTGAAGSALPADLRLSDFQRLIGDATPRQTEASPAADMIAQIVGPFVRQAGDPSAPAMLAAVDKAMSAAMRLILHHPDFQAVEAQWRTLDMLARRIETDTKLQVTLFDVSAEELAADLAAQEDLSESGFLNLVSAPLEEDGGEGYSALVGLYTFEETPPHAELLGRIARVAAHVDAPFITAISPGFLETPLKDRHPLIARAWDRLRAMPEARHLALATPRFLLRHPYGRKTDPIDSFDFEEFTPEAGLRSMLWANPASLVAVLLAQTWKKQGKAMKPGTILSMGDLPVHVVTDAHGDQVALPCTERNITTSKLEEVVQRGFQPVVNMKGRGEVRLASVNSVGGGELLGPWSGNPPPAAGGSAKAAPTKVVAAPAADKVVGATSGASDDDLDDLLSALDTGSDGSSSGDDDLDALLAGLDEGSGGASTDDDDLDALLAGFGDSDSETDAGGMDPDLAALLEGL